MNDILQSLPIFPWLDKIADETIDSPSRFLVLTAETAAGKSTSVSIAFLDRVPGKILMLEPRRLATVAIAERISEILDDEPGGIAGYRLHLDSKTSSRTRIEVITEAILTRRIQADPSLSDVSVVILDEFHERSIHADLALALLREVCALRDDLYVVVMSATIDARKISEYLAAPVLSVPGRRYPVKIEYATELARREDIQISEKAARAARMELTSGTGSILVFLPGISEIRRAMASLEGADAEILILHSSIPREGQNRVMRNPEGNRRIILSSSIAETSLTVPDVTTVIDSGLARIGRYDAARGMGRLSTETESVFSAEQRAGRAGRLGPGKCVRLWDESDVRVAETPPEILRADLAPLALECALWGVADPGELEWLDRPPESLIASAKDLLAGIGAIDGTGKVTDLGRAIAGMGVHPRLGAVALAGGIELAVRYSREGDNEREAARMRADLERRTDDAYRSYLKGSAKRPMPTNSPLALLAGFPDRIARHISDGLYQFPSGRVAALPKDARQSIARPSDWIVAPDVDSGEREGKIWAWENIDESDAMEWITSRAVSETRVEFAGGSYSPGAKIKKTETVSYGKIVLIERPKVAEPGDAARAIVAAARKNGLSVLPWSDSARNFVLRARFRETARGQVDGKGASEEELLKSLEDWLVPFVPQDGRLDEGALLDALRWWLDGERVDRDVPLRIQLGNGLSRPIVFEELVPGAGPEAILETRIQDLFGCKSTPEVLGKPVLLRLLSPAQRPVQITRDLAGFWKNTWPEVVKELKGRYPKHKWPDNPLDAPPPQPRRH
ncbi:MAG TPA: ATP-dependent helicase HrpB [Treponemataceae bacterium]|nr:ATP-dependent helicase HrpB [Treponemataceae bacterium]